MSRPPDRSDLPHTVYRAYNDDGILLYVGCSWNHDERMATHAAEHEPWVPLARRVTTETFPDMASARASERRAIKTEKPVHNMQGLSREAGRWTPPVVTDHDPLAEFIFRPAVPEVHVLADTCSWCDGNGIGRDEVGAETPCSWCLGTGRASEADEVIRRTRRFADGETDMVRRADVDALLRWL